MSFKNQSKLIIACLLLSGCGLKERPSVKMSTILISPNNVADEVTPAEVTLLIRTESGKPVAGVSMVLIVSGSGNVVLPCGLTDRRGVAQCRFFSTKAESKTVVAKGIISLSAQTQFMKQSLFMKNVSARRNAIRKGNGREVGSRLPASRPSLKKSSRILADTPINNKNRENSTLAVPTSGSGAVGRLAVW